MQYTMKCANGWTATIEAPSILSAKQQATKQATHDCGTYSIESETGFIFQRRQWRGLNAWGWHPWERVS